MVGLPARDPADVADSPREQPAGRAIGRTAPVAYDAFISYSHAKDKPIATALQSVVQKLGKPWYRRRALRVFRDDTSLSATPHLWPSIEQALGKSRFLILLASPEAAASRWVGQEIVYWLDHHSADTVLIALTEGELDWDETTGDFRWSNTTPLPTILENRFATEPRWVDLRPYRNGSAPKGTEFMGLGADFASAIRGIPKEDLLSEEVRQQRRARTLAGVAAALLVALLAVAFWQSQEARLQRNEAQLQRDKARAELLAMQARRADAGATLSDDIERAGALALESIEIARNSNWPPEADAIEVARGTVARLPLRRLYQGSSVLSLAMLPDGRLASGGEDGKIKIWPTEGTDEPVVLVHTARRFVGVSSLAVLPDGQLASGSLDGKIKLWPKEGTGKPLSLSYGPEFREVHSLAVLADGRLASGDVGGEIKLWSKGGKREPVVLSHGAAVSSLAVSANGQLASGGADGTIKLWPKDGKGEPVVLSHGSDVFSLAVLADGRLASGGGDGKIKLWPKEGTAAPGVLSHGSDVFSLAALADGRLASGGSDGKIKLWPREGSGEPIILSHGSSWVRLAVLADERLASGGDDGNIKLWPEDGTSEPVVLAHGRAVWNLAVLADGRLASAGADKIKIWPKEGTDEPVVLVLSGGTEAEALAALADGRLASGGGAGKIKLWPKEGTDEPVVLSHGSFVRSMAVLADGRLVSGGDDGKIKLWPKEARGEPVVLSQGGGVHSLVVLPDGRLAAGDDDGNIKIWVVDEQKLIAALCLRAGRNLTKAEWARYIGADTPRQPSCRGRPSNWRTIDP